MLPSSDLVDPLLPTKRDSSVCEVICTRTTYDNIRPTSRHRFKSMAHLIEHIGFILMLSIIVLGSIWFAMRVLWSRSGPDEKRYDYSVVEGYFLQDAPPTGKVASAVLPRLGLIDDSPTRWSDFRKTIKKLQSDAPRGTFYKVFFLQRHGQGFHNVAESQYGTDSWDKHWSKLYTDGNLTWGPDPSLTPLGIEQAQHVNSVWKEELAFSPPLPEIIWSSPLRRAADTLVWTYKDTAMNGSLGVRPMFKENLRESIGLHTCDARSTSYFLKTTYGKLQNPDNVIQFDFEPSFETHDVLWKPDQRESEKSQIERTRKVVDELFRDKLDRTYISLVGHGGTISSFFKLVGHKDCESPTGSLIPVVVRARAT